MFSLLILYLYLSYVFSAVVGIHCIVPHNQILNAALNNISPFFLASSGEHGWVDMLNDVGRKLDKADTEAIQMVAQYLKQHGQYQYAREMYKKIGDHGAVVQVGRKEKDYNLNDFTMENFCFTFEHRFFNEQDKQRRRWSQ